MDKTSSEQINLKKNITVFEQVYSKKTEKLHKRKSGPKKESPPLEISRDNVQIVKGPPYMETSRDKDQKTSIYSTPLAASKTLSTFHSRKTFHIFQLPVYYIHNQNHQPTTLPLPWTS